MDGSGMCLVVCLLVTFVSSVSPALLPDYIMPCKADNTLDTCALKHGQSAIPKIINGDPKYKIPKLDPFLISKLVVNQGNQQVGLNITLKNSNIHGLTKLQFVASRIDLKKKHVEWEFFLPRAMIVGGYKADGKILILPITGDGTGNITLLNMKILFKFNFKLEKQKGDDYVKLTTTKLTFNTTRMYIRLENLFNGDKTLSQAMHRFLDENWREVVDELGPAVGDAIGVVFKLIFSNIAALVPYKNIFLK